MKINLPKKQKGGGGKQQQHWTIFCQVSVLVAYQLRCQLRCIHLGCLAERDDLVSWSLVVKFGNCYVRVLMSTCRQIDARQRQTTQESLFDTMKRREDIIQVNIWKQKNKIEILEKNPSLNQKVLGYFVWKPYIKWIVEVQLVSRYKTFVLT